MSRSSRGNSKVTPYPPGRHALLIASQAPMAVLCVLSAQRFRHLRNRSIARNIRGYEIVLFRASSAGSESHRRSFPYATFQSKFGDDVSWPGSTASSPGRGGSGLGLPLMPTGLSPLQPRARSIGRLYSPLFPRTLRASPGSWRRDDCSTWPARV